MKTTTGRPIGRLWAGLFIGVVTFVVAVLVQSQLAAFGRLSSQAEGDAMEPLPSAFVFPMALAIGCLAAVVAWAFQVVHSKRK